MRKYVEFMENHLETIIKVLNAEWLKPNEKMNADYFMENIGYWEIEYSEYAWSRSFILENGLMFYLEMGAFSISQNMWDLLCLFIP